MAHTVKNLSAMQQTWVRSLGQEDPLEKGMATDSSILAWRIPGQKSLAGYNPWGRKELDTIEQLTLTKVVIILLLNEYIKVYIFISIVSNRRPFYSKTKSGREY